MYNGEIFNHITSRQLVVEKTSIGMYLEQNMRTKWFEKPRFMFLRSAGHVQYSKWIYMPQYRHTFFSLEFNLGFQKTNHTSKLHRLFGAVYGHDGRDRLFFDCNGAHHGAIYACSDNSDINIYKG